MRGEIIMKIKTENGSLTLYLEGRIDTNNGLIRGAVIPNKDVLKQLLSEQR